MRRPPDVDVVVREHPPPAGEGVDVELPGLLKRAHLVQAVGEDMRCVQRVGVVVTEPPPTPSEGILAELAGVAASRGDQQ